LHELTIVKDDLGQTGHWAAGSMLSDKRGADMLDRPFGALRFHPGRKKFN
jgi:hypothetical protein